jgi:cytoskeleton protein RodZ
MTKVTQISLEDNGTVGRRRIHLREISGDSEAPLETVGQDLRAARLRRGDDLATVSRSLKIRKDHLEALEEDNFAGLPGKTYAIGFVRSYAGYLGLEVSQTLERYKQEISGRHDDHHLPESTFHEDDARRLPYGWRIVAGFVGLALIYGVWHLVSAGPAPQTVPPAPALVAPRPQVVAAAKPAPAPEQAPAATTTPPPAAGNLAPTRSAAQTADAQPVAKAPPALSDSTRLPTVIGAAVPQTALSSGPGEVYGKANVNPRVVIKASGDTRVTVRGPDGTTYLNRDLKAGDSYQVPDEPGISLATSNAGAVEVVLDGMAIGKVGQNQQILGHVSLDPQTLVGRLETH